jgi:NADPH:quinone reductase-like Zn-dependent oxidoreductase
MSTHAAVVTVAARAPLEVHQVPTITPSAGEVQVRVEWTASTPLDLHQSDSGILIVHPYVLGSGGAGTVIKLGPGVKRLKLGDKVNKRPHKFSLSNVKSTGFRFWLAFATRKGTPRNMHYCGIPSWSRRCIHRRGVVIRSGGLR